MTAPAGPPVVRRHEVPADTFTWEPSERWVRGEKAGVTVVDSRRPILVWEPGRAVPVYAFPYEDVRTELLRPAAEPATGTHSGSTVFHDLEVAGKAVPNAAWTYPADELAGYLAFEWSAGDGPALDHWYEEDEEVLVHPRDPYKRVDALRSTRHVRVEIAGTVVADTHRPVLLFETRLPVRYYIPRADVRLDLFTPSELRTGCPYKGTAAYWSLTNAPEGVPPNLAWSYPDPIAEVAVTGHIAFYNEAVDITVDGVRLARPTTDFSARLAK